MIKRIAVFGAGISGLSVAKLARSEEASVTIFDEQKTNTRKSLSFSEIEDFNHFIFSPGFNQNHKWRVMLQNKKNVQSELAYASERWKGKIYGITGTNGKTSLTRFLKKILDVSGKEAYAVGNIGIPMSDLVNTSANHKGSIAVCEISSFQAELKSGLCLDALIWTNFSEDHLDSYFDIEAYFQAKLNLVDCLKKDAPFIVGDTLLNYRSREYWKEIGANIISMDVDINKLVREKKLHKQSVFTSFPQSCNFLLALSFAEIMGIEKSILLKSSNQFSLDDFRLEKIYEGSFFNIWQDSKATNLGAVLGALKSMNGRIFWIGGGASKGTSLKKFTEEIAPFVDRVFTYGSVGESLARHFKNLSITAEFKNKLVDSIRLCVQNLMLDGGKERIDVLFSPGFSSFDQFPSYNERGKLFEKAVFSLLEEYSCL